MNATSTAASARLGAALRRCVALFASAFLSASALHAFAQSSCPSNDPDTNYNCPIGPVYVMPSWGNVPWSYAGTWQSIDIGDLDGDGYDELVGRDAAGVHLYSFNAAQGVWLPVLTTDGSKELLLPLSDAAGYGVPGYEYKLVDLDGNGTKQLVVRAPTGLAVYKVVPGTPTSAGLKTATWTNPSSGGPFGDNICFSIGPCWYDAPYYRTIRYGDIDGLAGAEVIGWGGDGIVAWKWTGSGWTQLASPTFIGGDAALLPESVIATMQFAKLDANPGQRIIFFSTGPAGVQGMYGLRYTPGSNGGSWAPYPNAGPVFAFASPFCSDYESCWRTLKGADLDGSGVDSIVIREPFCMPGLFGGMVIARVDPSTMQWKKVTELGPFSDCADGTSQSSNVYAPSIQFGYVTGSKVPELLGRLPNGINVYQWNGTAWNTLVTNSPQLSDPTWSADPSFYAAIRTAKLPGSTGASLLARGQNGVRTWSYANGNFSRPLPYGGFPPFTGPEATAYTALQNQLNLATPIRDAYTSPTVDNTASTLRGYISQIVNGTCTGKTSDAPPQYSTCTPAPGTTNPAFTNVVNQVIKELWLAAFVVDYFTTMQTMQTALFVNDNAVLPAIDTDLQLAAAANKVGLADYLGLFSSILKFLGPLQPALTTAGNAIAVVSSSLPFFAKPSSTSLQQSYDQIQSQVGTLVGTMQNANLAQKHHVLGDYVLLNNIGRFVGSQLWTFDQAGYGSANRQAFAQWVYQTMLPALWQNWDVTNCGTFPIDSVICTTPPQTANFANYQVTNGVGSFIGLLPPQQPCTTVCTGFPPHCNTGCQFSPAEPSIVKTVFTPVSNACTYNPQQGTSWTYGCTFGVGQEIFYNTEGWKFAVNDFDARNGTASINTSSAASGLNDPQTAPVLRMQIIAPITVDVDLRTARLRITRLMQEPLGAEELVKASTGQEFGAALLLPASTAGMLSGRFDTASGSAPRISAAVQVKPRRALSFDVSVDQAAIVDPQVCIGAPEKTRLNFRMELSGGGLARPLTFEQAGDWECVRDAQGVIRMLRAAGKPAKGLAFFP